MRKVSYIPEDAAEMNRVVMTGDELMGATATVVRTIARDHGTDIVFAGDGAATNGKQVILPSVVGNANVTARQALVIGGFANHETLHKLLSSFDVIQKYGEKWRANNDRLTMAMANAIEDVRIEHGGQHLYNGMAKAIDKTSREVTSKAIELLKEDPEACKDFARIGPVAVTWEGRMRLGYPDEMNAKAMRMLSPEVRKRVKRIVDAAMVIEHGVEGMGRVNTYDAHQGCEEAYKLAERIIKRYRKEMEKKAQQEADANAQPDADGDAAAKSEDGQPAPGDDGNPGDGDGANGDGQGDSGSGDADGDDDGDGDGNADGNADGYTGTYDGSSGEGDGDGTSAGKGAGGYDLSAEPEPFDPNLDQVCNDITAEINRDDNTSGESYRVLAPLNDRTLMVRDRVDANDRASYVQKRNQMGSSVGTIRRKLERALTADARTWWQNGKTSGRLDVRTNASNIIQLNTNVFRRRVEEPAANTALQILVDLSGSMRAHRGNERYTVGPNARKPVKITVATQATIAVCEALAPTGVSVEVLGHHTYMDSVTHDAQYRSDISRYGRTDNIWMRVFKEFDEPLSSARGAIAKMEGMARYANADGDAIVMAAKRLLERHEERKVMFVLSDGAPAWNGYTKDKFVHTRDCIEWVRNQGIRVVGLGILDEDVRHFYPEYVVVYNLDDFAKVYIDEVARILLKGGESHADLMKTAIKRGRRAV